MPVRCVYASDNETVSLFGELECQPASAPIATPKCPWKLTIAPSITNSASSETTIGTAVAAIVSFALRS